MATPAIKLELVDRAMLECRVPRNRLETTEGTLTGQIEQFTRWIDEAWSEIQGLHDNWGFLRGEFTFDTTPGVGDYSPDDVGLEDHREWLTDTFRLYRKSIGINDEQFLYEWEYNVFRDTYRYGPQVDQRPFNFAVRPGDDAIMLGPKPDHTYTIYGEYLREPQELLLDGDEPLIKKSLRMIIVYKAMTYYGLEQGAPEVVARGERGYATLLTRLEREELPDISFGEPMA